MTKQKKINLIVGCLVVGALFVLLLDRTRGPQKHEIIGKSLVSTDSLAGITAIEIKKMDTTLSIANKDSGWRVSDGTTDLPLDGSKIANFFDDLSKAKVQRVVQKELKTPASFGLDAAAEISITKNSGQTTIRLGSERAGGGQFIQLDDSKSVFLLGEALKVATDLEEWELKVLVSVKDDEIKEISYERSNGKKSTLKISRDAKEKPLAVTGLKDGEKTRDSAVNNLAKSFEGFQFDKRLDKSNAAPKAALAKPIANLRVTLFDGRVFTAIVGQQGKDDDKKYYMEMSASVGKGEATEEQKASVSTLNELNGRYYFEVSNYSAERIIKERSDVVEKVKKS